MKIEKSVNMDIEVEVDISLEDIVAAISEETDYDFNITRGVNNAWMFLKSIPDTWIKELNEAKRAVIYQALKEQVQRFAGVSNE